MHARTILYPFAMIMIVAIFSATSIAQTAWIDTTDATGKRFRITVNEKTGTANQIMGLSADFSRGGSISQSNIEELSREFLDEYSGFTKVQPSNLLMKRADQRKGRWSVKFQQLHEGVPVYGAYVGFTAS